MKRKKLINYLYAAFFSVAGIILLLFGFYFFWTFYFAMGALSLIIAVHYIYFANKKEDPHKKPNSKSSFSFIGFLCRIIICVIAYPIFTFIPGANSYRPLYTYEHYYNNTNIIKDVFPDEIPSNASDTRFCIFSESINGQSVSLSFYGDKEIIENYTDNIIRNQSLVYQAIVPYDELDIPFIGEHPDSDYTIYYTNKTEHHNHATGMAVSIEHNYICFFDY